jgi:hypothetical protein
MIIIYYFTDLFNKQFQCSSSTFIFILFFHNWIFLCEITYFEQIFMLTQVLNHNLMQTMGCWFLLHLLTHCFLSSYTSCGFGAGPIIRQFTKCFNILFLNFCDTQACMGTCFLVVNRSCFGLAHTFWWVNKFICHYMGFNLTFYII